MPTQKQRPIIIKRKVSGSEGHNGGAWKVAYADFVTALMALFIVLWLMSSSAKVKAAVAGYFRDPSGTGRLAGTQKAGTGTAKQMPTDDMEILKQQLESAIKTLPKFQDMKEQISITITSEGLRIELMETKAGMFFELGSPKATDVGVSLLRRLSAVLGKLPNRLLIEGHTDSAPYAGNGSYSNWELSCDRANQARQLMQASGMKPGQVFQVRGFADQQLRNANNPTDPANRRVSVIVQFLAKPSVPPPPAAKAGVAQDGAKPGIHR